MKLQDGMELTELANLGFGKIQPDNSSPYFPAFWPKQLNATSHDLPCSQENAYAPILVSPSSECQHGPKQIGVLVHGQTRSKAHRAARIAL